MYQAIYYMYMYLNNALWVILYYTNLLLQTRINLFHSYRKKCKHARNIKIKNIERDENRCVILYFYNTISISLKKSQGKRYSIFGQRRFRKIIFFCISQVARALPVAMIMAGMDSGTVTTSVGRDLSGRTSNHHRSGMRSRNSRASGMRSS